MKTNFNFFNFRDNKINFFIFLILFVVFVEWVRQFLSADRGLRDIQHMVYFGWRLLEGDFHWVKEFDDKLPVLQMMFVVPALFDEIKVWYVISLAFVLLGSVSVYHLIIEILEEDDVSIYIKKQTGIIGAVVTVYLFTFLPGGLAHINIASSSLAVASIVLLLKAMKMQTKPTVSIFVFVVSAFFSSVAMGVRPYILAPVMVGGGWVFIRDKNTRSPLLRFFFWMVAIAFCFFAVNVLPYFFIGEVNALLAGVNMFLQDLTPQTLIDIFRQLYYYLFRRSNVLVAFFIFVSLSVGFFSGLMSCFGVKTKNEVTIYKKTYMDVFFVSVILPFSLFLMILLKHFWSHYLQMFVPFFGVGFGFLFYFFYNFVGVKSAKGKFFVFVSATVFFVLASAPNIIVGVLSIVRVPVLERHVFESRYESYESDVLNISNFINKRPEEHRDFLYLDSMYIHWKLRESRHGFPHAWNTVHIAERGWWKDLKMPIHFGHPINAIEYCEILQEKGPSIVLMTKKMQSFLDSCFFEKNSIYSPVDNQLLGGTYIFERKK